MSLTTQEREALACKDGRVTAFADALMENMVKEMGLIACPVLNDDRLAKLEAAVITYVKECYK